jgi:hypothetical protein
MDFRYAKLLRAKTGLLRHEPVKNPVKQLSLQIFIHSALAHKKRLG